MFDFDFDLKPFRKTVHNLYTRSKDSDLYMSLLKDAARAFDKSAQKGIAKVTGDLSNSFYMQEVTKGSSMFVLEFGYDVFYAAYNDRGSLPDGSKPIRNRTPPGREGWFTDLYKDKARWIYKIADDFYDRILR